MHPRNIVRISRRISLVLRHKPQSIGLKLDAHGWAEVDDLLQRMTASGTALSRPELEQVVAENNKQRFRFSEDGTKIRANQGHSINVDLQLKSQTPPKVLFHGTASTSVAGIMATGLQSRKRQHVHLSHDTETATMVGKRHGKPVIMRVDTVAMVADGHDFFCSENGVWLTREVPVKYLRRE